MKEVKERFRRFNQKGFTLIELMATLAILALIIAIAIPAVGNILDRSAETADESSIELMERAGELADVAKLPHDGGEGDEPVINAETGAAETEAYRIPTLIEEGYLNMELDNKFNKPENYVVKVNKSGTYVYKGEGQRGGSGEGDGDDNGDSELPPGLEDIVAGSCTISGEYGMSVATEFDWKYTERNVLYMALTMSNNGDYVAIGQFGGTLDAPRSGVVIDRYNKDLKLIDANVIEGGGEFTDVFVKDMIQNENGDFVVIGDDFVGTISNDLTVIGTMNPGIKSAVTDSVGMERIIQSNDGSYMVAGILDGSLAVSKLDSEFNLLATEIVTPHVDAHDNSSSLNDLILLSNGNVLIAASETLRDTSTDLWSAQRGRMVEVNSELNVVNEFNLHENGESYTVRGVGELDNGTIVAYTGEDRSEVVTIRSFDEDFNQLNETVAYRQYGGYTANGSSIFVKGNEFSAKVLNEMVTYDSDLNILSADHAEYAPYGTRVIRDGDSYISFDIYGQKPYGLNKVNRFGDVFNDYSLVSVDEVAPRAIHTAPPKKENITGYDTLPEGDAGVPEFTDAYLSEYNELTNRVNAVYKDSILIDGDLFSGEVNGMYLVLEDGTLSSVSEDEALGYIMSGTAAPFILSADYSLLTYMDMGGPVAPAPDGAIKASPDSDNETPRDPNLVYVDDCYTGAFMIQIEDMMLYRVQADGSLVFVGDPALATPESFGFDIYNHALFYVYPPVIDGIDGRVVSFPDIDWGSSDV